MDIILVLLPLALAMGLIGLVAFIWALRNGQFDDPEGDARRILENDPQDFVPLRNTKHPTEGEKHVF